MAHKHQEITAPLARNQSFSYEQLSIISMFQRLFTQLAVFMRSTIDASVFNLPSLNANAQRLFGIPADFRNAFMLFYGPELANRMNDLLTNFIANGINVIEGYTANNQDLINASVQRWYKDADTLSLFLATINLFWDENQWRNLLYQYIQLKLDMIYALLTKNYEQEIRIYDRVFDLTTIMGTYMARGLIAGQLQPDRPAQPTT